MIDLLTLPVPADPAATPTPVAPTADGTAVDFAALLGEAAPTLPVATAPLVEGIAPVVPAMTAAPVEGPPVPLKAVPAMAADPAVPPAISDEPTPVEGEPQPVKLPTLPVNFFAQRLPAAVRTPKAEPTPVAATAEDGEGEADDDRPATVTAPSPPIVAPSPLPVATAALIVPQAPPPPRSPLAPGEDTAPIASSPTARTPAPEMAPLAIPIAQIVTTDAAQQPPPRVDIPSPPEGPATVETVEAPAPAAPSATAEPAVHAKTAPASDVAAAPSPPPADARPSFAPQFADVSAVQPPSSAPQITPAPIAASVPAAVVLDDLIVAGASDSAWLDRLAADITTLATGDRREASLTLIPRSLGEVSIKLDIEDRHARVHFTVDTPQALSLMADGAPRLAQLVEANGLKLDGATVDLDQRRDGRAQPDPQSRQQEPSRGLARAREEVARLLSRTRINTATERFA